MTDKLNDLIAQKQNLDRQIAELALPQLEEAAALLAAKPATTLADSIAELRDQMPEGQARDQVNNVHVVLTRVPEFLSAEMARMKALTAPADAGQ